MRIAALALILLGCSGPSEVEQAEAEYNLAVRTDKSASARCAEGRKVQDAYKRALDEEQYRLWKLTTDQACLLSETNRRLGLPD